MQGMLTDIIEREHREHKLGAIAMVSAALRTAHTRAEMLPIILDQLVDLLKADGAALTMCDPAGGEMVTELARGAWADATGLHWPPGEGVSGFVIATGQPYLSNDLRNDPRVAQSDFVGDTRAVAGVPLIAQGQTIGALWMGRKTDITNDELHLLTAIGDVAANAIHRAILYEQTQRRLQRLTALRAIDMAITASLDLRVTLNVLLDQVTTQLGIHAADVLLLNPHTQLLEYTAGRGFRSRALQYTSLRLGEGHAGRAALERNIVNIPNIAEAEDGLKRSPLLVTEGFIAYYAAPLIAKGQVKGVLEIFHRAPLAPDSEWLEFLEALAAQAAIAIDNASLFSDLQRSNVELTMAYDTTLEGWSRALHLREKETERHTQRVTELTLRLARVMGMSEAELLHVRRGALLHDIGKMAISDSILLKPGPLTEEEWESVRQHPVYAYEFLSPIAYLRPALDIPYYHHEKWDGTGYPRGLKGEQIPLAARIFAVVDAYDAMISDRPYRPAISHEEAIAELRRCTGTQFDPAVVEVFLPIIGEA
jgi:HD-GYP domain-containing protein (c-di-GMP phosphodiesterase class II)